MLTLTRTVGETIIIGTNIKVAVAEVRGNTVRLSIDAPREIKILREEVHQRIQQAEQIAAQVAADAMAAIAAMGSPSVSDLSEDAPDATDGTVADAKTADQSAGATDGATCDAATGETADETADETTASADAPSGWTHAEAKGHTLVERLLERCAVYGGTPCATKPDLAHEDWCERCLAAEALVAAGFTGGPATDG